jgi:DMSO/TMAO reductase YedYZ molybdopterin-dependent catalytic subunit
MKTSTLSRRQMLQSSAGLGVLAFLDLPSSVMGLPKPEEAGELIHFVDAQPDGRGIKWENLESWITPNETVFAVSHYGTPTVDLATHKLEITGLVKKGRTLTVDDLRKRPRKDVIATLECSGNSSSPSFAGAIGNVRWTGTPLGLLLRECAPLDRAIEVVFFGADEKIEKIRDKDYLQNFARALSLHDAMREDIILAYDMNGQPLPKEHGAPLRLVVPGWFGIAWVKWLSRIEVLDRRYMSKYMAREYVTIRGEEKDGKTIWRETSVGPIDVKSVVARAFRLKNGDIRLTGAAWTDGTPLKGVEVQVDDGLWKPAEIDRAHQGKYTWKFWNYTWKKPFAGEHKVVSRAIDAEGRIQPASDDPPIKMKRTYWEANQQWVRTIKV